MRVLLTNDDGIAAPGLVALYQAIADLGDVHVVAPATVQSAKSHSVTFDKPVAARPHRVQVDEGGAHFEGYAIEGSPADCVKLALTYLVPQPIDLAISGMNAGANVGINVIYSGTVAAAIEAAFMGVPAIAVSLHLGDRSRTRWAEAAAHARRVINRILAGPIEPHTVMNINVPILDEGDPPRGLRVVPISTSPLLDQYESLKQPAGHTAYQALDSMTFRHTPPDTDVHALFERYITLTPLHFDLTLRTRLDAWSEHFADDGPNVGRA
jgi:5'/3'-nucleotidase